jgi:hypothetical protein
MKFMMLIYETKEDFEARTDEARKERYWPAWKAFTQSMRDAGILANPGNILQPGTTAYSVNCSDGQVHAREGSHSETPEQLSGYYVIDVRDTDEAIEWASRAPAAVSGVVELRPVFNL